MQGESPPAEDNDAKARPIRVHHTKSSITSNTPPFPSEGSISEGKSKETDNLPLKKDIDNMAFTVLQMRFVLGGTFGGEMLMTNTKETRISSSPPTDSYPQDHLSPSQSRYQVFNFDKVIDFATIDRRANNELASMSMVPILLCDKYVIIKSMSGMSRHNLRIGDFKSILPVHDPKNNTELY